MKSKRRTVITLETHETTIVRARKQTAFCEFCQSKLRMLTPDAAVVLQSTARLVFRRVETGELHFLETATGSLMLCGNSVLALKQK